MSHPKPAGFTTPGSIVGALASQLQQLAGCSSAESNGKLDPVGQVNFSVVIEALCNDRQRLSPAQAQRYLREVLCERDRVNRDLYERAALGLSAPQRSVTSSSQRQESEHGRQQARDEYRAAAEKDLSDWRKAQQTPSPLPSEDGSNVETAEGNEETREQAGDGVLCPQCRAPMEAMNGSVIQGQCLRCHGEDGMTTWTG
jgi:hypothetical protein